MFLYGVGCQCLALSANIYPSRRALALCGDMEDQDRNTFDFKVGMGVMKKSMNTDIIVIDPVDYVAWDTGNSGGRHEHKCMQYFYVLLCDYAGWGTYRTYPTIHENYSHHTSTPCATLIKTLI